jgi:siroheme synthase-like protein
MLPGMPKNGSMRSSTKKITSKNRSSGNRLFPVFLKIEQLRVLIVGGGKVAGEKLNTILVNAPSTSIRIVSREFSPSLRKSASRGNIELIAKEFEPEDLVSADIVFSAVNDAKTSKLVHASARKLNLLHNAADKPNLCDFYLGSVVQKGNLKIGISTNGKSPTVAKRLKSILEQALPDEIDRVLHQLSSIRKSLSGDLTEKVKQLNAITSILTANRKKAKKGMGK